MKRKIYDQLLDWKRNDNGSSAILIDGARRVGKSYIAEEFGRREYKSYILINFARGEKRVKALFDEYLDDLDTFFSYLEVAKGIKLYRRESLIIFDEIEYFPKAREAIKHFVADGRYDYIETGSLVSIAENVKDIGHYTDRIDEMIQRKKAALEEWIGAGAATGKPDAGAVAGNTHMSAAPSV